MPAGMVTIYNAFVEAERQWSAELRRLYGERAGDVRYTKEANGEPGTALAALIRHVQARARRLGRSSRRGDGRE